jgi:hypothetical protein
MTEIFVEKALQVCGYMVASPTTLTYSQLNFLFSQLSTILAARITSQQDTASQNDSKRTGIREDMFSWLNRTALDIIGLAGFGYEFNSLANSEPSELNKALATLFTSGLGFFSALQALIPPLRIIVGSTLFHNWRRCISFLDLPYFFFSPCSQHQVVDGSTGPRR